MAISPMGSPLNTRGSARFLPQRVVLRINLEARDGVNQNADADAQHNAGSRRIWAMLAPCSR
jgi:hypothetical protein